MSVERQGKPGAGFLYVVATPIGNLEDITLRALRVLREVDLIAAEDTRVSRRLLDYFGIQTPLIAYHQHSDGARPRELAARLGEGARIALISDAGMPGITDPGAELIALAIAAGVPVVPVPGPMAAVAALAASGLPSTRFAFEGFPPRADGECRAFFEALRTDPRTLLLYESPRRLVATLQVILSVLGERRVVVARDVTKSSEEFVRGTLGEALARLIARAPTGEYVIVLEGAGPESPDGPQKGTLASRVQDLTSQGVSQRDAVRQVAAALRLPRRQVAAACGLDGATDALTEPEEGVSGYLSNARQVAGADPQRLEQG